MYGEGISRAGDILDLATEFGIIQKSGSWYSYEGERLGQGRENSKDYIKNNPEFFASLDAKIRDMVKPNTSHREEE
jgi:recombination protein RecA